MGFRFKLHDAKLPGKPDIVLPRYKAVILVNGCFWHGHGCHLFKWPSSRIDFWKAKITRNQQKDDETLVELKKLGWRVLIIWECATKGKTKVPLDIMLKLVAEWIVNGGQRFEVRGTDVN
jgi:DNA mismatch endonuclease (patch repair protein)